MTHVPDGPPRPGPWQTATVTGIRQETPTAKTSTLTLPVLGRPVRRRAPDRTRRHQDYLLRYPHGYTCHFPRPGWVLPRLG